MCASINAVHVLGIRIDLFTTDSLQKHIAHIVQNGEKAIVANVNVHAMNLAFSNAWFAAFLNSARCVFCDGDGVILGARLLGEHIPEKITYAQWLPEFAHFCAANRFSLFLLGGEPGVADKAARHLRKNVPDLPIVGTHHGFFCREKDSSENKAVIDSINRSLCDILLVCFGMPAQERWLSENWGNVNACVALTGGAALDYAASVSTRPPRWMTENGLEWLGRLALEPRRLWKRYLIGNPLFILRVLREKFSRQGGRGDRR